MNNAKSASGTYLPQWIFVAAIAVTIGLYFLLVSYVWESKKQTESVHNTLLHQQELSGIIRYLDEVSTLSVRMAVATGSTEWQNRYRDCESILNASLKEEIQLTGGTPMQPIVARLDSVNTHLAMIEQHALGLVRAGQLRNAENLISSEEYRNDERSYSNELSQFNPILQQYNYSIAQSESRHTLILILISAITLCLLLLTWMRVRRIVTRYIDKHLESEKALQSSEAELRALFSSMKDVILVLDRTGRYLKIAPSNPSLLYKPSDQLIGKTLHEIFPRSDAELFYSCIQKALETKATQNVEYSLMIRDAETWFSASVSPMTEDSVILVARDITERRHAEEILRESEEQFRTVSETSTSAIFIYQDDKFQFVNRGAELISGYTQDELLHMHFWDFAHPDYQALIKDRGMRRQEGEIVPTRYEFKIVTKNGEERWLDFTAKYIEYKGRPAAIGTAFDITERKRVEQLQSAVYRIAETANTSKSLNELFIAVHTIIKEVMPANNFYIALLDHETQMLSFPYFVDEVDVTPPQGPAGRGLTAYVLRKGKSLLCNQECFERILASGEAESIGAPSPIWLGVPLIVDDRTIGAMVVQHYSDPNVYTIHEQQVLEFVSSEVGRAIERKWTEDKLRESEERYRRLVDLSPDAIAVYTDGRIVFVNRAAITLLGAKSPSEVIGKPVVEVIHPDSRRMAEERINLMLSRGEELPLVEEKFVRLDGTPIDVDIAACSFIYEGKKAIQVVVRNITERKKTQEALQRQTSFYQQLFESSPAGIVLVDNNKIVLNANRAFEKMFQYTCGEIGGKHIDDFIVPEALLDEARGLTTFAQQGKTVQKETIRKRKDGTLVNVAFTGYPIFVEKEQVAVYGMYIDITQEKKLEENLRQAQKMESLGTLAGGIAHDFNNLLAIIMGHAALLDQAKTKDQAMKKSIETITKATHRGAGLVRQLLTFARKSDILMESVNVNETITELTKLLHETFPKTITVVTDLESNLPSIIGDTNQIHQLMLNLCINARDAMAGGGTLTLSTRTAGSHSLSNQFPQSITTEYVKITVADTGTGMDEATRGRIFEPFFTTKERGKGTGLGLATVYGIIESHGGFVDVDSNPGQGTTFCIYFPIQEQTAEDFRGKEKIAEEIRGGKETILVIEDEEVLRELLHDILTSSGYTVILAEDGLEGMNVYLQRKDEIDLVVSDIGLPKMGGQEVFYKLKEFDPEVKVLLASGFLDPDMKIKMFEAGARGFIPKPYAPNDVLQKIRNVLD